MGLATTLNDHQEQLNRIIGHLDAAESFDELDYWIGELEVAVSTIETLTKSMAKYTEAQGDAR